jgi:uncharacterized protein DUF4386
VSTSTAAAILLVAVPLAFNVAFGLLAARFDYPDILRLPTDEVLIRFRQGGSGLVLLWWAFALSAVLLAPLVVLLSHALEGADGTLLAVGTTVGVLAATVQFLGLIRWPFLVPYLARVADEPNAGPARRDTVDVVFQSFNRYLGIAVGEHLGYSLTGAWTVLAGGGDHAEHGRAIVAWRDRHDRWRRSTAVFARIRRAFRTHWLEARGEADAHRLHRLVAVAHRYRHRPGVMSVGRAIAIGAVSGLVLGILISVSTDIPLAPEVGLALGALVGWLSRRDA